MGLFITAPQESWQYRAVEKTGGNQSELGCYILATLGWQHGRKPPRFGSTAWIDKDGIVHSHVQTKEGQVYLNQAMRSIQEITDNFRGLADELKLNDDDREAMFTELRKWIAKDERAHSTI